MKKRKPPFALVGILAVFIGVAAMMSSKVMTSSGMAPPEPAAPVVDDHHDEEAVPAPPSTDQLGDIATQALDQTGGPQMAHTEKAKKFMANTVLMPERSTFKPKKSDTEVSTLWWDEQK